MTQTMPKYVAFIELNDGSEYGPIRVGLASKIQANKTARANGWDPERDVSTLNAFMAWHAATTAGLLSMGWDEFLATAMDAITVPLDGDAPADSEDPTRPAHLAG